MQTNKQKNMNETNSIIKTIIDDENCIFNILMIIVHFEMEN